MKKALALLLVFTMVFFAAACTDTTPTTAPTTPGGNPTTAPTKAPDKETAAPTEAPLPSYVTDTAHPERYGGTVRYPYSEMSPSWDPMGNATWGTFCWSMNVFQTCLITGSDGLIYPNLCDYELSDDNLVITLKVRDGIKFSNGQDVTVDDIIASLRRSAELVSTAKLYLWDILDHYDLFRSENKIVFYMNKYDVNTMLGVFSHAYSTATCIMPKEICEKYPTKDDLIYDINDVIGSGPYKLLPEECEPQTVAAMVRNEYYKPVTTNPEGNNTASPCWQYLDKLVFYNMDLETAYLAIESGQLDALYDNTGMDTFNARLAPYGTYTFTMQKTNGVYLWFYNIFSGNRPVCDPNLRKAMAACFDYAEVAYAHYGEAAMLTSRVMEGDKFPDYVCPVEKTDWYNAKSIDVAKAYLAKSNYQGEELKLVGYKPGFNIAAEAMKKIGINCTYTVLDNPTLTAYAKDPTADWDIIFRPGPVPSLPGVWWSVALVDPWNNDKVKENLEVLRNNPYHTPESIALWDEIMEMYCDECPFVVMYVNGIATVCPDTLVTNRTIGEFWYHMAYWKDPENHMN